MSWLSDAGIAGAGFGFIGKPAMELGGSLIASKYASDRQGHEVDRQAEYDRQLALEMFNKNVEESRNVFKMNVAENNRVFDRNVAREDSVYSRDVKRADDVWEREKAYNLELWNKQNEYNSPVAQMSRLKAAGLNPRLMYGQGNVGNATAVSPSQVDSVSGGSASLNAAQASAARVETPHRGVVDRGRMFLEGIGNYIRLRQVGLATQQMALQNALMEEQAESLRIRNESDAYELGVHKKSGITRDDNMILKLFKRWWTDQYNAGRRFGEKAGKKYLEWRDRVPSGQSDMFIDGMEYNGAPSSFIPGNGDTMPVPLSVEPAWMQ